MHEYVGNLHMHTPYSDGAWTHRDIAAAALDAGLDFIVVTDHNVWVDGVEGYVSDGDRRVLLLSGQEIHDMRRQPQCNHMLVYGAETELSSLGHDPQALIDAADERGALTFLAHPHELDLTLFDKPDLGWKDWHVDGYTGLEIWNYMSSFANEVARAIGRTGRNGLLAKLRTARVALNPQRYITAPEPETLAKWDELLAAGKRVTAIGNSDAHGTLMRLGPIERIIFPYDFLFRAVNTHVVTESALTGDAAQDKAQILSALRRGTCWVGYDMPHSTAGFRFSGQGVTKGVIGGTVRLDAGATLQVRTPARCDIRLIRHGEVVAERRDDTHLTHIPYREGAFRVECTIEYEGRRRGWIYSNPIYLV